MATKQKTTPEQVLAQLEALGDEGVRESYAKGGAGKNQFGVPRGEIRKLANKLKGDHALALELWKTGNIDARLLAILWLKPKELSAEELDGLVRSERYSWVADWLNAYVVRKHPEKEALRAKWMKAKDPMAARSGWDLTAELVGKSPGGLDLKALLDRLKSEMGKAPPEAQWTMNNTLMAIGIHFAEHRKRAIAIGEKLGLYRDWPVSKGCIPPFAPVAIPALVARRK